MPSCVRQRRGGGGEGERGRGGEGESRVWDSLLVIKSGCAGGRAGAIVGRVSARKLARFFPGKLLLLLSTVLWT